MSSQAIELVLRRDRAVIVVALVVITGLAWAYVWWLANDMAMGGMDMAATGHAGDHKAGETAENIPPTVEFPYGFPSPGRYRIFIQMKHANTVETGVFDADVH